MCPLVMIGVEVVSGIFIIVLLFVLYGEGYGCFGRSGCIGAKTCGIISISGVNPHVLSLLGCWSS